MDTIHVVFYRKGGLIFAVYPYLCVGADPNRVLTYNALTQSGEIRAEELPELELAEPSEYQDLLRVMRSIYDDRLVVLDSLPPDAEERRQIRGRSRREGGC